MGIKFTGIETVDDLRDALDGVLGHIRIVGLNGERVTVSVETKHPKDRADRNPVLVLTIVQVIEVDIEAPEPY